MAAKELRDRFIEVCDFSNQWKDYDKFVSCLHEDVILKKVDDPESVCGIGNVYTYLKLKQAPLKPEFAYGDITRCSEWPSTGRTIGQVSGTGTYGDTAKSPKVNIRYTFTFTRATADEEWLLINAFAARM